VIEVFHVDRDNSENILELKFNPLYIYGIKIYLFEFMNPDIAPWYTI